MTLWWIGDIVLLVVVVPVVLYLLNGVLSASKSIVPSVRKIADRVAMLYGGRIVWEGAVDRIDASGNGYVDQFIYGRAEGPIKVGVDSIQA